MTIQQIADKLQELLGTEIDAGQLVINLNDRKVQSIETKGFYRMPAQKVVATTSAGA